MWELLTKIGPNHLSRKELLDAPSAEEGTDPVAYPNSDNTVQPKEAKASSNVQPEEAKASSNPLQTQALTPPLGSRPFE